MLLTWLAGACVCSGAAGVAAGTGGAGGNGRGRDQGTKSV